MAVPARNFQQQALMGSEETAIASALALLVHYYDLAPASARLLLNKWLQRCPADWARAAVIEALYQGRYRAISVEQILAFWLRRGKLTRHFTHEFEALISVPLQRESMQQQAATLISLNRVLTPNQPQRLPVATERFPEREWLRQSDEESSSQPVPPALLRRRSPQMHQPPIDQFTPAEDPSGFSNRLQEVAHQFEPTPFSPWPSSEPQTQPSESEASDCSDSDADAKNNPAEAPPEE